MWPTLIPNDILRANIVSYNVLCSGDIVVLPERKGKRIIHRLIRIKQESDNIVLFFTAGDRSGEDSPVRLNTNMEMLRVNGVLRNRKWKSPSRQPVRLISTLPGLIIRIHCKLVRKLFW